MLSYTADEDSLEELTTVAGDLQLDNVRFAYPVSPGELVVAFLFLVFFDVNLLISFRPCLIVTN